MNQAEVALYHSPSFFVDPIAHLQEIWTLILADFQSIGMSFQRVSLLAAYTIELLHQARSLPPENKVQRDQVGRFLQWYPHISVKAQGGYLNHLLGQSIVSELMMTGGNLNEFQKLLETRITYMLSQWLQAMKTFKKFQEDKTPFDVWEFLNTFLSKPHYDSIYDKLLFIEFIKNDLTSLDPDWLTANEKQLQHPESIIKFLKLLIPKVLFNVLVQAEYFPKAMTENNQKQFYDILYLNQNKHTELMKRIQFLQIATLLIENVLKQLDKLSENLQIQTLTIVLNYFYGYHVEHFQKACKFLVSCFEKLSSVVRFAKFSQILLFFTVLEKLNYLELIQGLYKQFPWIQESKSKIQNAPANPRNAVDIFLNQEKNLIVPASQKAIQLVEIFRPFSLVYFDLSCKAADIDVNFCYAGNFQEPVQLRKIIFEKKRLRAKEQFKGSVEAVQPGLYYLEFDNTYSWMTPKTIGYKLEVVVPMDVQYPFPSAPYSRFLTTQFSFKIPYQLTIDHNFFQRRDLHVNTNSVIVEGTFCDIKITANNYILTLGGYVYQLETQNQQSAIQKLSVRVKELTQKFNVRNYMINGKPHQNTVLEQILQNITSEIQNLNNRPSSPVEMLNDLESNRSSLEQGDKKLSIIKQEISSKPSSEIKTAPKPALIEEQKKVKEVEPTEETVEQTEQTQVVEVQEIKEEDLKEDVKQVQEQSI